MTDEAPGPGPREGIFLPDFDKVSREWRAVVEAQSLAWQAKLDELSGLVRELLSEVRGLRGVTVTVDRAPALEQPPPAP